jgi:hypothetical protein
MDVAVNAIAARTMIAPSVQQYAKINNAEKVGEKLKFHKKAKYCQNRLPIGQCLFPDSTVLQWALCSTRLRHGRRLPRQLDNMPK